jgi:purine-binding chemotaxis protein CheW
MADATQAATLAPPGKYLSFALDGTQYGLALRAVQEIAGIHELTRLPRTPVRLRGVIQRRGRSLPVLDLRGGRGVAGAAGSDQSSVIVVEAVRADRRLPFGVIVDEIAEVLSFTREQIEAAPRHCAGLAPDVVVAGLGRLGGRTVVLLDVEALALSAGEELEVTP